MWNDPIVEETRAIREAYLKKFDYDLGAIFVDLKAKEQAHPERMTHLQRCRPGVGDGNSSQDKSKIPVAA